MYHADVNTHRQVHEWCDKNGINVKVWVDGVLKNALARRVVFPEATFGQTTDLGFKVEKVELCRHQDKPNHQPVPKKKLTEIGPPADPKDEPWINPPFWAQKKIDSRDE